ncbi:GLABROUS1 enhancer-binding protein-like [Trifolium pratense]|nr:GLABROUS1 enhancer-binding protein-like [Trifolium pratense]
MAKKRQRTPAASKDDEPLTPVSKNDQPLTSASKNDPPPPSKKPEEEKKDEDDEDSSSEEASSSEGEEDDDSEDDESEEEQPPPSKPASKTPQTDNDKSESKKDEDDEDEEETDTDSDQEPPPKLKSINSKSIDETLKSKPQPKSSAAPARSGTKRSAESDTKLVEEAKQSKKKKTTAAADDKKEQEEDNKKPGDDSKKLFQRVFNEDDELAILEGLVDFTAKTGNDPAKYPTAFYDDVKKSIHFPVTLEQLKDKVRRLKLKFDNKMKSCKNGKTPTFSKPIEEKMFEFGKKIWGGNVVEENGKPDEKPSKKGAVKKSPTTKKLDMEPDLSLVASKETRKENPGSGFIMNEMHRFDKSVSGLFGSGMDLLKSGVELLEESKRIELEKRWKELQIAELKVVNMRAELSEKQSRLIMDALMSSSSD